MGREPIENRIGKVLSSHNLAEAGTGYEKVVSTLRRICGSIEESLSARPAKAMVVSLLPGFQADVGQQFNVVVEIPERRYQDTLFRAYVPVPDGLPAQLDFYGEEPTPAETEEELEDAIVEFLSRPEVKARLNVYRGLTAK